MGCAKVRQASSPEQAVKLMESATRDGNADQNLALLPKRQREFVVKIKDVVKRVRDAQHAFNEAMDSQFGKASDVPPYEMPDATEMLKKKDKRFRIEILSQDRKDDSTTEMKLKVSRTDDERTGSTKSEEVSCKAIKEDDGWKLNFDSEEMSDDGEKFMTSMFDSQIKGLEQTTADIKSGKIRSRAEAWKSLASTSIFKR
jgi:hypothetical protein